MNKNDREGEIMKKEMLFNYRDALFNGTVKMGPVKTLEDITENIINYEKSSGWRDFAKTKLVFPGTKYYLAYKVSNDPYFHFLLGKYVGYRWGGLENYDPYETDGAVTRIAVSKLLGEPFKDDLLYQALAEYYARMSVSYFSKGKRSISFWRLDDVINL